MVEWDENLEAYVIVYRDDAGLEVDRVGEWATQEEAMSALQAG